MSSLHKLAAHYRTLLVSAVRSSDYKEEDYDIEGAYSKSLLYIQSASRSHLYRGPPSMSPSCSVPASSSSHSTVYNSDPLSHFSTSAPASLQTHPKYSPIYSSYPSYPALSQPSNPSVPPVYPSQPSYPALSQLSNPSVPPPYSSYPSYPALSQPSNPSVPPPYSSQPYPLPSQDSTQLPTGNASPLMSKLPTPILPSPDSSTKESFLKLGSSLFSTNNSTNSSYDYTDYPNDNCSQITQQSMPLPSLPIPPVPAQQSQS